MAEVSRGRAGPDLHEIVTFVPPPADSEDMRFFTGAGRGRHSAVAGPDADAETVVRVPDPSEFVWLEEHRELLRGPQVRLSSLHEVSALFDEYCVRWHGTDEYRRWSPDAAINALGVALGDIVAERAGLTWMVAARTAVEEVTVPVLGTSAGTAVASPLEAVSEHWARQQLGWMGDYVRTHDRSRAVLRQLKAVRRQARHAA